MIILLPHPSGSGPDPSARSSSEIILSRQSLCGSGKGWRGHPLTAVDVYRQRREQNNSNQSIQRDRCASNRTPDAVLNLSVLCHADLYRNQLSSGTYPARDCCSSCSAPAQPISSSLELSLYLTSYPLSRMYGEAALRDATIIISSVIFPSQNICVLHPI